MWLWQCHKTQRQMMLHVGKCKGRLSPNAAGSMCFSWQLCWHDARLTDMAVISSCACKEP
ncbi:hypothetical protein CsSME_00037699 [Camellia sinensis var. sinensis]